MKLQRLFALCLAPLLVPLLVACGAPPVPFDPDVAGVVEAVPGAFATPVAANLSLAPGTSVIFRVEVPRRDSNRDLLFVEIQGTAGLSVELLSSRGASLAAANDPRYFARRRQDLNPLVSAGVDAVTPQVDVNFRCVGPCAATGASVGSYYVEVRNPTSGMALANLYAYLTEEADPNELNDFVPLATPLSGPSATIGRIERIGDLDYFRYTGSVSRELRLDTQAQLLDLRLVILGGPSIAAGQTTTVFPGETFVVRSHRDRAAAAGDAGYTVTIGATASGATLTAVRSESPSGSSVVLSGGETRSFLVTVSEPSDLLYVGASASGADLEVRLLRRDGELIAVSRSREAFAESLGALATVDVREASNIQPSLITYRACPGPCVAVEGAAGTYLLELRNLSGGSASVNVYAHTVAAEDPNDRGSSHNDTLLRATRLQLGSNFGAIELLDDVDFFFYDGALVRSLTFTAFDANLGLRLRRQRDGAIFAPGGAPIQLLQGDRFRVYAAAGLAGPASTAGYFLEVSP
jgi:hypothetical protein